MLPLSWNQKEIQAPRFKWVNLPLSGLPWVYNAEIPADYRLDDIGDKLNEKFKNGFLVRGCRAEFAEYMSLQGYDVIRTGAEGVIDLRVLDSVPDSLSRLADRGEKCGQVKELPLTLPNQKRVSSFMGFTPHALKPHLRFLFNTSFDANTRCFVINTAADKWLGVITVSTCGQGTCHTEMILRHSNAPVGVMEFLFLSVMKMLKSEGFQNFSLGEVPFITPDSLEDNNLRPSVKRSIQESLLFKSGHMLRYAFNYKGLYDFKNKFDPVWEPVYICSTAGITILSLLDMFYKTGYFELSGKELVTNIRAFCSP
jgi:hypothetical protein